MVSTPTSRGARQLLEHPGLQRGIDVAEEDERGVAGRLGSRRLEVVEDVGVEASVSRTFMSSW